MSPGPRTADTSCEQAASSRSCGSVLEFINQDNATARARHARPQAAFAPNTSSPSDATPRGHHSKGRGHGVGVLIMLTLVSIHGRTFKLVAPI